MSSDNSQNPTLDLRSGNPSPKDKSEDKSVLSEHKRKFLEKIEKSEKREIRKERTEKSAPFDQEKAKTAEEPERRIDPVINLALDAPPAEKTPDENKTNNALRGATGSRRLKSSPEPGTQYETLEFPPDFLWGVSTSAYQIEGGVKNNWSEWEKSPDRIKKLEKEGKKREDYICGAACDSYNRYQEDFKLAEKLNCNAFRLGLEWARMEPEKDSWNVAAINHYRAVIADAKRHGFRTIVTLWHWTTPDWFAHEGGWTKKQNIVKFLAFADMAVKELGADVDYWITLNEPMAAIGFGYLAGSHPPGRRFALFKSRKVYKNLVRAHLEAYDLIHSHFPHARVGISNLSNYPVSARRWFPLERLLARLARYFATDMFLGRIKDKMDFIGLNYYKRSRIIWRPPFIRKAEETAVNDMGWEIYPAGLYRMVKYLSAYGRPILITENGSADADDDHRPAYIKNHLAELHRAISEGADVRGYFHWSLLDNFEWAWGWEPKFGLYAVDRKTFKRAARPSAAVYREICRNNSLKRKISK